MTKSPHPEEIGKLVERLNDAVRYSYLPHGLRGDLEQAASALTALVEERDELRRTRDEAIRLMSEKARELGEMEGRYKAAHWPGIVDEWQARAQAAEAERDRLRAASEPFLRLADEVINAPPTSEHYTSWLAESSDWMAVFSFAGKTITLGDLRKAAQFQAQALKEADQ